MMTDKLLSFPQLIQLIPADCTQQEDFPAPVKLPFSNQVYWFKSEVLAWAEEHSGLWPV